MSEKKRLWEITAGKCGEFVFTRKVIAENFNSAIPKALKLQEEAMREVSIGTDAEILSIKYAGEVYEF